MTDSGECTVVTARATLQVAMSAGCGFLMHCGLVCGTGFQPQCSSVEILQID